jgi:ATP-dependent DNA helicase RecG
MLAIGISDKTRKIEGVNQHTAKLNELLRVPFDFCNPSIRTHFCLIIHKRHGSGE